MQDIMQAFELFAAGVAVASTGALLAVVYIIFSPALENEIRNDSRQRPL
jgi:hypothetical protein